MLTINADGHPLMQRFHAPGDEKRSIVVLAPDHYEAWLRADDAQARQMLANFDPATFVTLADPRPRTPRPRAA